MLLTANDAVEQVKTWDASNLAAWDRLSEGLQPGEQPALTVLREIERQRRHLLLVAGIATEGELCDYRRKPRVQDRPGVRLAIQQRLEHLRRKPRTSAETRRLEDIGEGVLDWLVARTEGAAPDAEHLALVRRTATVGDVEVALQALDLARARAARQLHELRQALDVWLEGRGVYVSDLDARSLADLLDLAVSNGGER